jgi:hypothetical protein
MQPRQGTTRAPQAAGSTLRAIDQQRSELNSQLTSLTIQRDLLNQQTRNADPAGQAQLQAQIKAIGDRTAQVIKQMAALDDAANKVMADGSGLAGFPGQAQGRGDAVVVIPPPIVSRPGSGGGVGTERIAIFGIIGVTVMVVFALQWLRRPRLSSSGLGPSDVNRLERLQQAVDVIAVEVERIAESQRYLSKALTEGKVLGSGPAEDLRAPVRERAKAP